MEEARKQFIEQQKNQDVEREIQNSTNIPVEPTVEDAQRLMVIEQDVDDMVQFQVGPITNMIPNLDRQKEYRKKKLHELTVQEREEQRKRNDDRQRAYRERKSNQLEEARNQFAGQQKNQNVERQRQNSTNITVEPTVEDAQRVTVREQRVDPKGKSTKIILKKKVR